MADSYGTNGGFVAYHTARGRALMIADYDDDDIAPALLVGSEFVDGRYVASFPGTKVGQRAQVREWPRTGGSDRYGYAIPSDSVPVEIENATYEAALRQLIKPGGLSVDFSPNKYRSASVDGAVSVTYAMYGDASSVQPQFIGIDQILAAILTGAGNVASYSGGIGRI